MGNRTSQTAPGGTTTYTYDANNRLTQAGTTTYTYDANGNLTATSTGRTFTWDVFNRLTQATGPGGTVTYTSDGDGLKRQRVGPDGTRRYYYDGIRPIWEADGAGVMIAQLDRDIFGNLLSRREASGARRYYHFDGVGSTTALTNESGAATSTLLYDAWGNQRAASGSDQGRYRFTGAELDAATGLYHMGARFYDPTIGRWLSEDPVRDRPFVPGSLNLYAYVVNNPGIYVDPRGTTESNTRSKSADERLQEYIDALNALNRLADALHTNGWSHLANELLDAANVIGPEAVLALAASQAVTRTEVLSLYRRVVNVLNAAIVVGTMGSLILPENPVIGNLLLTLAIELARQARRDLTHASRLDLQYYGGTVFQELNAFERWILGGRPRP